MTEKRKENKYVDDRIEILEGDVNTKLYSLIKTIDRKIQTIIGKDRDTEKVIADLLVRNNELEEINRIDTGLRPPEEIAQKRKEIYNLYLEKDRTKKNIDAEKCKLEILDWMMGK